VVFIPIRLRNQKQDKYQNFLSRNRGTASRQNSSCLLVARWLQRIHAPGAAHTLTEVDGIVEIGGVGPATQKEVVPAQANTSRKRDAAQQHSQQQPVAPNGPRPNGNPAAHHWRGTIVRGHRVATGGAARGGAGGEGGDIVIEVGGGCRVA
jgi:hypothetical protein